jgi:iron complex transport system ATP-binding protein
VTGVSEAALLEVSALSLRVAQRELIRGVSLRVQRGELWCVLGANGAGKTLFLHTVAGLRRIDGGTVALGGKPLGEWTLAGAARIRGFLPQSSYHAFPMPVQDAVLMGRHPHLSRWGWEQDEDFRRASVALRDVGLDDIAARDVTTLSGGERQRVAIAALLAQDVPLMLLDEAVAHLDLHHQILVLRQLRALADAGCAVMLSIHELNLARRFATHAMLFRGGGDVDAGPVDPVMSESALTEAFRYPVSRVSVGERRLFIAD